jgi:hypothetical protein
MSTSKASMIIFDNIQHQAHLRDHRIGRSAKMILGTYATAVEHQDFDPIALDLDEKLRRIRENKWKDLTIDDLHELVDRELISKVGILEFLRVLVNHVPELAGYRKEVDRIFE